MNPSYNKKASLGPKPGAGDFPVGAMVDIIAGWEAGRTGIVIYINPRRARPYTVKVYESLYAYCTADELEPPTMEK